MITNNHKVSPLSTDLYQFTCSYAYYECGKHEEIATFECFYRKNPFKGEYCILAGIKQLIGFVKEFKFDKNDIDYLRTRFPDMKPAYFDWLSTINCSSIQIETISQGEIVFPKLPLIILTGPLALIQIIETPLLNLIGFPTLVATNASRMITAANNKKCIQFGLRRAQGPNGGLSASQYSYLGGFSGTSNALCGKIFGIPTVGTMSHAFITSFSSLQDADQFQIQGIKIKQTTLKYRKQLSFTNTHDGQLAAFLMYARSFPTSFTTLIDTYSSINSGLKNTIIIAKALEEAKITKIGVRLDSGDLVKQAKQCKQLWNKYFTYSLTVFASNDLSQDSLIKMQAEKSEIDVYAVGTNIATCQKQPALGVVYKLVEFRNKPTIKFSEEIDKLILPGRKNVYRIWTQNSSFDLISLITQTINQGQTITVVDSKQFKQFQHKIQRINKLNKVIWKNGQVVGSLPAIQQAKKYYQQRRKQMNPNIFLLEKAQKHNVYLSQSFNEMFQKTLQENKINIEK